MTVYKEFLEEQLGLQKVLLQIALGEDKILIAVHRTSEVIKKLSADDLNQCPSFIYRIEVVKKQADNIVDD